MIRTLSLCALLLTGLTACNQLEYHDETDDSGFRTAYATNPETGEREGELKQYLPDGKLLLHENYVDGQLQGERKVYYEDGKLLAEEHYTDGMFDGPYVNYQPDGKVKQRGSYTKGVMTGKWYAYHPNGNLKEEVTFSDNEENGPFREWYQSGKPKASGHYLPGGKEQGQLFLFSEAGQLHKIMNCESALCRTSWTPDSTTTAPALPDMSQPQ